MDGYFVAGVVAVAVYAVFAHVNAKTQEVKDKIDRVMEQLDGLREYLYEIDPQFDDERASNAAFERGDDMFAGYEDFKLIEKKEREGRRTLNTPFFAED